MTEKHHIRNFASELRSLVLTTQVLAEYAVENGDRRSAAILENVAGLLELTVAQQTISMAEETTGAGAPVLFEQMAAAPR